MEQRKCFYLLLLSTILLLAGCSGNASDEIGFGSVEDSVYYNDYFDMAIPFPADWNIQDQETLKKLTDAGGKMMAGDDENLQAVVKASELQTVNLFAVFKHPIGTPVQYNPNIVGVAERIDNAPGVQKGEDYLFHTKRLLESSRMKLNFPDGIITETIGGQPFSLLKAELPLGNRTIQQKYYATVIKGYALSFVASYETASEEAELADILALATFE